MNKKNYVVKQSASTVFWIEFENKNQKGESLVIELTFCKDNDSKNSLPKIWHNKKYIDRVLESYWCINTYVKDSEGRSWGKYNPQHKKSDDGNRLVINFDWMMEATEANKEKLIDEVYRIFSEAKGKSATEEKIDKVYNYAKKNSLEVVTELPEGFIKNEYATDPCGCVSISNLSAKGINRIKAIKEGIYQRKLLLLV